MPKALLNTRLIYKIFSSLTDITTPDENYSRNYNSYTTILWQLHLDREIPANY